ncbi:MULTISPECIES: BamA/TamA family outer membrane protein [Flammeovirga]|uniref:BamA/TamA family outer membrane protein n=1 Tax=Flammeovirga agarivorans TaxID=2726742 RepID=A0A7X8SQ01_9BACT|nr:MULTISPECIES: BamA/TamA family outer membrane protein [Flammeovirga]NLR94195.1 BamA/TamA family outer membrane protein [Flammeovirga agarivorans]
MKFNFIKRLAVICLILINVQVFGRSFSHLNDSTNTLKKDTTKVEKKRKNLRFSILGGPGYTPDYGFLIGASALFTFSTDTTDKKMNRSVVPIAGAWLSSGGFNLLIKPQLFFNHDRFRYFGQIQYLNNINNYYGVGFDNNQNIERGPETTEYFMNSFLTFGSFLFRIGDSDFFLGPSYDVGYRRLSDIAAAMAEDPVYMKQAEMLGGGDEGMELFNVGIGFELSYDTRDIPANAWSGIYFDLTARYYDKWLGSDTQWGFLTAEYRQYKLLPFLGERRVLAWTAKVRSSFGDVPFTEMSMIGSPFDLRGYYQGQYRDKSMGYAMAEYRHMFNSKSKLLNRLGFAFWGGVGMVGPEVYNPGGVLPNFGGGLRIEVQPRMNFRIDVGKDPIANQTLLYFNMTEAF